MLVGSLDGSDVQWRYPHSYVTIERPTGDRPPAGVGRCGNTNPLRPEDFVVLGPGQAFNPYRRNDDYGFFGCHALDSMTFTSAGRYTVTFHYSTEGSGPEAWNGGLNGEPTGDALRLLEQVPPVSLTSNTLEFRVSAKD